MEASIIMPINRRPHLFPMVHNSVHNFADFKVDMHNIYIRVRKDPVQNWTKLPFIAIEDTIFMVLDTWPPRWHAPDLAELEKTIAQKRKDDAKLCVTQLAKRKWKEKSTAKVRVVRKAAQAAMEQKKATTTV